MKVQAIEITLADGRKVAAIAAAFHAPGNVAVASVRALPPTEDAGYTTGRVVELYGVRRDD
jgi:hypothetical protein